MKTMKKILCAFLVGSMLLTLGACGGTGTIGNNGGNKGSAGSGDAAIEGYVLKNKDSVELGAPDTKLDPQEVYSKITYTPEMFYGDYCLPGGDEAEEKFGAETEYFTWTSEGEENKISKVPFRFRAGEHTMAHSVNFIEEYNWVEAYFMHLDDDNEWYLDTMLCSYEVNGNKLILCPLESFHVDTENNKITYKLSEETWEYTFAFSGRNLTLTNGGSSVTLTTGLDPSGEEDYFYADTYLSPESPALDNIDHLSFRFDGTDDGTRIYFEDTNEVEAYNSIGVLSENGLFTFTIPWETGTKTYQYVYFHCGYDGIVLTDGTNTYYYNDSYSDRNKMELNEYVTEEDAGKLEDMNESQLEMIVQKKENLMEDLVKAFEQAGIKVSVNEKTGEMAMDASVLFGGDSAVLTDDGKDFLNKFVDVYTSIVFSEKYEGFVSKTMVEGHTAPVSGSTYESGLPLSEERANNVKDYCISSETGVDTSKLAAALEAVGYSNSKPVYDADGNVDMAASRRVSFRFIINLDEN